MDYRLLQGDCIEIMPTLAAGSIDAVITDPPYIVTAGPGGGAFGNRSHLVNTGGFTDGGVDHSFLNHFNNWFCFCSKRQLSSLIELAEMCDHWNLITWAKPNPVPTCNNKYLPDVEYIVHGFSAGHLHGTYQDKQSFFLEKCGEKSTDHPNEKPLSLMLKLVRLSTLPGQTVLDPFMGSGTTGVACKMLGRNFIGIELDAKYYRIAERRIANAQPPLFVADVPTVPTAEQVMMFEAAD